MGAAGGRQQQQRRVSSARLSRDLSSIVVKGGIRGRPCGVMGGWCWRVRRGNKLAAFQHPMDDGKQQQGTVLVVLLEEECSWALCDVGGRGE